MSTTDCKALPDTCTTGVYAGNAFRILSTSVDVSARRLKRHGRNLQAAIAMGTLDEEYRVRGRGRLAWDPSHPVWIQAHPILSFILERSDGTGVENTT